MNLTIAISTPFVLTQRSADKTADAIRQHPVGLIATAAKAIAVFAAILSFPVSILIDLVLLPVVLVRHLFFQAIRSNPPQPPIPPRNNVPAQNQVDEGALERLRRLQQNGRPPAPQPAPQPAPGGAAPARGLQLNQLLPGPFRIGGLTDQLLAMTYADGNLPNDNQFFRDAMERALANNGNEEEYRQLLHNHGVLDLAPEGGEEAEDAPREPSIEVFQWSGANAVALYLIHKHLFPHNDDCPAFLAHARAELDAISADFNRLKHPARQNDPAAPVDRNSLASVIQQIRSPQNRILLPENMRQIATRIIAFSQTRLTQHPAFLQAYANTYPVAN